MPPQQLSGEHRQDGHWQEHSGHETVISLSSIVDDLIQPLPAHSGHFG